VIRSEERGPARGTRSAPSTAGRRPSGGGGGPTPGRCGPRSGARGGSRGLDGWGTALAAPRRMACLLFLAVVHERQVALRAASASGCRGGWARSSPWASAWRVPGAGPGSCRSARMVLSDVTDMPDAGREETAGLRAVALGAAFLAAALGRGAALRVVFLGTGSGPSWWSFSRPSWRSFSRPCGGPSSRWILGRPGRGLLALRRRLLLLRFGHHALLPSSGAWIVSQKRRRESAIGALQRGQQVLIERLGEPCSGANPQSSRARASSTSPGQVSTRAGGRDRVRSARQSAGSGPAGRAGAPPRSG
jgi:hypothetical protein